MVDAVQEVVRLRAAFDANACIPKLTDFVAEFFFLFFLGLTIMDLFSRSSLDGPFSFISNILATASR